MNSNILEASSDRLGLVGTYHAVCRDKDGNLKWEKSGRNTIVTTGANYILTTGFNAGSAITTWYMGLIDTALGGSFGNGTTSAEIENAAHIPEYTDYDEATRPEWTVGNASSRACTNSAAVVFTISTGVSADVIPGFFIVSVATKSGTTGTLWCAVNFTGSDATVDAADTVNVTYTITVA